MSVPRHCPRCGTHLSADAPAGLCPACLLAAGLADPSIGPLQTGEGPANATGDSLSAEPGGVAEARTLPPRPLTGTSAFAPKQLAAGDAFGNYRIIRRLGAGGMGTVFEAEQQPDGRRLALKVLNHAFDSAEARVRFLREGRLAAAVNHPNSVYVYGTEEIAGTPVILMELVRGGTLEEVSRSCGPLPVGMAVDALLQVISGLEAAAEAGILHRDIKPSNCFVDADGTVKIGDFGLSISTVLPSESQLVDGGTFQGTPAFASPEQMRGEMLDVRSDIYAVGVTLFYLCAARPPFPAPDLLRLMVAVLDQPAPDLNEVRPDVSRQFTRVVARCLKKSKEERYQTYAELRAALEPFASQGPIPARPLPRLLAGASDFIIPCCCFLSTGPINVMLLSLQGRPLFWIAIPYLVWLFLASSYFAVPEWLWGASAGKAICGLRVVGPGRQRPSFLRSYGRAMIYLMVSGFIEFEILKHVYRFVDPAAVLPFEPLWPLVLFVTARRNNGMAAVQDLLTGTRVVAKRDRDSRERLDASPRSVSESGQPTRAVGPYAVLETFRQSPDETWSLAYDPRLLRRVWIRESRLAQIPRGKLASISRNTRVRWLAGQTTDAGNWDAFEAPTGQSLLELIARPRHWLIVRHWMCDLADELAAAAADGTLPDAIGLDRVWITADGRAKLMDFAAWGTRTPLPAVPETTTEGPHAARAFLGQVAKSSLEGRVSSPDAAAGGPIEAILPVHARAFLDRLPKLADVGDTAAQLHSLLSRRATITPLRRLTMVMVCCLWPFVAASLAIVFFLIKGGVDLSEFDVELQRRALVRLAAMEQGDEPGSEAERRQLELFVSDLDRSRKKHDPYGDAFLTAAQQERREQLHSRNLNAKAAQAAAATISQSFPELAKPEALQPRIESPFIPRLLFASAYGGFVLVAIVSLVAAILFRGLARHALGIVVVNRRGERASRLRVLLRTVVAFSPVIALQLVFPVPEHVWLCAALVLVFFAGAVWATFSPMRSVQDKIAGTRLVPH